MLNFEKDFLNDLEKSNCMLTPERYLCTPREEDVEIKQNLIGLGYRL